MFRLFVAGSLVLAVFGPVSSSAAAEPESDTSAAAKCVKPELADRPRVTKAERERTAQAMQDYIDCMRPALDADRKRAEAMFEAAKAAAQASNDSATAVNAHVDAYRKWEAEHQGDEE